MRLLKDPEFLSATIGAIYGCVLDPGRWTSVLSELAGLLQSPRAFLGVATSLGDTPTIVAAPGYTAQDLAAPEMVLNPMAPLSLIHPLDRPFVVSRDFGLPQLQATRYYREYLAPRDIVDAVAFVVTREGNAVGHWLIPTPPTRGPITAEESGALTLLAPHIRRAVEISRVLGVQRLEAETCRAALGQLDSPVLIFGLERGIAFANPSAERALEGGQVLRNSKGYLHGATGEIEQLLGRLSGDTSASGGRSLERAVIGTDGEERLLFAVRLDLGPHHPSNRTDPFVLLVMRSPREDTRNPVAIAARTFGLTSAQVQVLTFLAQGHSPEAIADILGVSVATVRSHLRDLFAKSGTSRQAELVARTLSLASPLRPTPPE